MLLLLLLVTCGEMPRAEPGTAPGPPANGPVAVAEAFPPPAGAVRTPPDGFGAWLGTLELAPADEPVRTHNGAVVAHHARVVRLPLVPGDLQQCADSAIRLRAEWLRIQGDEVSFHATSGDPMPWSRWEGGERPYESDNRLHWRPGTKGGWEAYLAAVFTWAGTRSLVLDTVEADTPRPGDLLVDPGSPGHAVVLLDVAERDDELLLLVGEGFMPAQSFHVELGPVDGWWLWDDGLALPHWSFEASQLRRWR
ncbi:MAG: hypothetical protein JRJ84_04900 [Deltaproteobacteria bacterium]|nr:hypothetical protein [Deltaproteobacteria bacterium]